MPLHGRECTVTSWAHLEICAPGLIDVPSGEHFGEAHGMMCDPLNFFFVSLPVQILVRRSRGFANASIVTIACIAACPYAEIK